ncbi:hypothetical protein [Celeribacter sp. PS-C1]|uniref:hypothetical protein n=1 Tax=Celeribacter sp. PS-C1 TaxID=2820813 RepID=UPI001CA4E190|nr:hypothetical protein [Celeribacter sp. PS-C1]MBW6417497.1 hypothetical protein [Celeribacter sp. PS-C1]
MLDTLPPAPLSLRHHLEPLIENHGFWPVLKAAFAARRALRHDARLAKSLAHLSPHLRHDIGLPPEAPPERNYRLWLR